MVRTRLAPSSKKTKKKLPPAPTYKDIKLLGIKLDTGIDIAIQKFQTILQIKV